MQTGMCDEVSLVVAAAADGYTGTILGQRNQQPSDWICTCRVKGDGGQ